ncbi:hypothetical protein B9K05_07920 [Acetobacter syzygii]|uniref:PIN domain-containing protein n=1 Tax=Acetobacter syzygii TaxID=146476 RepID=A0A270BM20_9PROT|nr:hypothetical protein B9K05_07920 [Acetobacter syzygii]PAL26166.1 hypothetical protein B9K04_07415 [Acetobacter syzygii]
MRYLLDTNVLSETRRKRADPKVTAFLKTADAGSLFISVLTIGELRKGISIKGRTDPDAAGQLAAWVDGIEQSFADRIVSIDTAVSCRWGELSADRSRPVIDTLIAATALVHGLTLVTRSGSDLHGIDVPIINPWEERKPERAKK